MVVVGVGVGGEIRVRLGGGERCARDVGRMMGKDCSTGQTALNLARSTRWWRIRVTQLL